ncbi:MAG: glycosyltransferase [Lutibacter sp.]
MNKIKSLKVIQIIDSLAPGGAERMAVNIANELAFNGVSSFLCATRNEGILKKDINKSVKYLFLNKKSTLDFYSIFKLNSFIKQNNIQIIHAHSSSYFISSIIKILHPSIKLIWHDHFGKSNMLNKRKKFPINFFSNKFNQIISVNNKLALWSKNNLHCNNVKVLVNFAQFTNNLSITKLKGFNKKRIIHLANFRPQKDHLNMLKAFKIVIKKHPDWSLHLIGLDLKDSYSNQIHHFIEKNDLQHSIFTYGVVNDIQNILNQASIGVLSSISEGLPVSLIEYGMAKLPIVVTNVGDCNKIISHKENGFLCPKNNPEKLSYYLQRIIENNDLKKEFGLNLHKTIENNFSKEFYLKNLISIYHEC